MEQQVFESPFDDIQGTLTIPANWSAVAITQWQTRQIADLPPAVAEVGTAFQSFYLHEPLFALSLQQDSKPLAIRSDKPDGYPAKIAFWVVKALREAGLSERLAEVFDPKL